MSGGRFDYNQYRIRDIREEIEHYLKRQGQPMPKNEIWGSETHYEKYPKEIQKRFREGIKFLKIAEIYAQRIDWFLSGDDGEENFIKRLAEELSEVKEA